MHTDAASAPNRAPQSPLPTEQVMHTDTMPTNDQPLRSPPPSLAPESQDAGFRGNARQSADQGTQSASQLAQSANAGQSASQVAQVTESASLLPTQVIRPRPLPAQLLPPVLLPSPQRASSSLGPSDSPAPSDSQLYPSLLFSSPQRLTAVADSPQDTSAGSLRPQPVYASLTPSDSLQQVEIPALMHKQVLMASSMPTVMLPVATTPAGNTTPLADSQTARQTASESAGQSHSQGSHRQPRHRSLAELMKAPSQISQEEQHSRVAGGEKRSRASLFTAADDVPATVPDVPNAMTNDPNAMTNDEQRTEVIKAFDIHGATASIRCPPWSAHPILAFRMPPPSTCVHARMHARMHKTTYTHA